MSARALPEYWRHTTPRPTRPPIDWPRAAILLGLGAVSAVLVMAGGMLVGVGAPGVGWVVIAAGVVLAVGVSQEGW